MVVPAIRSTCLRLSTRQFILPKEGTGLSECEDATGVNYESHRYAVADGATEAFDSRNWAIRLAESWVNREPPALTRARFQAWVAEQGDALHAGWIGRHLPWYAEEKARGGSFAAFVGIQFQLSDGRPAWSAIALGDSCLVHLRDGSVRQAMPISDYRAFDSAPLLVPSLRAAQETALRRAAMASGRPEPGDLFLLLSDAVAAWYLRLSSEGDPLLKEFDHLLATRAEDKLRGLFERERRTGSMKDDDLAILKIEVGQDDLGPV